MGESVFSLPLLDFLAYRAGHAVLSDLHYMDELEQARMARILKDIPPEGAGLREWNDALEYLARLPPEETAQAAHGRLMEWLTHPDRQG